MSATLVHDAPAVETAPAPRRTHRVAVIAAALAAFRVLLAVPYAVFGPGLFMDDWWVLRNIRFDGVLAGAGRGQALARPGAWLLFNLEFGLAGEHPLVLYGIVTLAGVAVTVALFFALRRLTGTGVAAAVAAVYALLPNHSTLDHWASAIGITVGLAVTLTAVAVLARAYDEGRPLWPAVVLFVAGAVCCEAVLALAGPALVAVPWLLRKRVRWAPTITSGALLAGVAGWMLFHTQKALPNGDRFADFALLWPGHFGRGIAVTDTIGKPLLVVTSIVITVIVARLALPTMRSATGRGEWIVVAGLAVVLIGALPFAKFPISVIGVNDRANVVSSIGSAMVWAGVALVLKRWPAVLGIVALAWLVVVVPARWQKDRDWALVGREAATAVSDVSRAFPTPAGPIVVGPEPFNRRGIVALVAEWDTSAAVQLRLGDLAVSAATVPTEAAFCASTTPLAWDSALRTAGRARCAPTGN